jgi:hypothetical protein
MPFEHLPPKVKGSEIEANWARLLSFFNLKSRANNFSMSLPTSTDAFFQASLGSGCQFDVMGKASAFRN